MNLLPRLWLLAAVTTLWLSLSSLHAEDLPKVLFFTKASAYQHQVTKRLAPDQLSLAESQLLDAAKAAGAFDLVASQDPSEITAENLKQYAAVVFFTSGELPIDKEALFDYVKNGGGFAAIHNGIATFRKYPPYAEMLGAGFDEHPWDKVVTITVEDQTSPATQGLGASFTVKEEVYQVKDFDRSKVHVLLSLDNSSVDLSKGHREDHYYPLSWTREFGQGRIFCSAFGHHQEVWHDPKMLHHFVEGIRLVMRKP